ncbi:hypothetical protein XaC1_97 [Xanthomonas phage XaC1]|nr:hypothetical protein XaC1_97 [Xanthomonas phage XaC1]
MDYILYFKNDEPKIIWFDRKRAPYAAEERTVDGHTFWLSSCTYRAALNSIIQRSTIERDPEKLRKYEAVLMDIIDPKRGDGFTILMETFDKWHELLNINCEIPEEYQ